jgi:hypothetical protein
MGVAEYMKLRGASPAFYLIAERARIADFDEDGQYLGHRAASERAFAILDTRGLEARRKFAAMVNEESDGEEGLEIVVLATFADDEIDEVKRLFEHFDPTGETQALDAMEAGIARAENSFGDD